jgi:hypothetical protein
MIESRNNRDTFKEDRFSKRNPLNLLNVNFLKCECGGPNLLAL